VFCFIFICLIFVIFSNRVSLCRPGWVLTCNPLALASQMLELSLPLEEKLTIALVLLRFNIGETFLAIFCLMYF
jgi:hypothetical protein